MMIKMFLSKRFPLINTNSNFGYETPTLKNQNYFAMIILTKWETGGPFLPTALFSNCSKLQTLKKSNFAN